VHYNNVDADNLSGYRYQLMKWWSGFLRVWCPSRSSMRWKAGLWKGRSVYYWYHCLT